MALGLRLLQAAGLFHEHLADAPLAVRAVADFAKVVPRLLSPGCWPGMCPARMRGGSPRPRTRTRASAPPKPAVWQCPSPPWSHRTERCGVTHLVRKLS